MSAERVATGRGEARRPLRIALIGARGIGASYSGIETYYEEVGRRLAARGHHVVAYCRRRFTPDDVDGQGVVPVFRPCLRTKHTETLTHTFTSTLDVLFRSMDVVQYHALGPSLFAAVPRWAGAKTIASIRGLDWQREKWGRVARGALQFCERQSYRLPHAVSVVSKTLRQHYADQYGVTPRYIPNGVTLEDAPPPREILSLGVQPRRYVLFMGRISPEKGVDVLIEAFRRLDGNAKLVVAGSTSYTDDYIDRLRRTAPPEVIFPGRVGGRLRTELYAHAAAFVLPSTIEGLSVALLEAMGFGACVVTSDIPENRELVDGIGLTHAPGDVDGLSAQLRRVLASPGEAAAMGRLARQRVEADYTWDAVAERTEAFYYEVLSGARTA